MKTPDTKTVPSAPMARPQPGSPVDVCLAECFERAREWMPRWLEGVRAALADRERASALPGDAAALRLARTALRTHQEHISRHWLNAWQKPPAHAPLAAQVGCFGTVPGPQALAQARQLLGMATEDEWRALNARLTQLGGFDAGNRQPLALHPDAVLTALLHAWQALRVEPAVLALWMNTGAVLLGKELRLLYRHLTTALAQGRVRSGGMAAGVPAADRLSTALPVAGGQADSVPAGALVTQGVALSAQRLQQLLAGNLARTGHAASDQGSSGAGNAMVKTLAAEIAGQLLDQAVAKTRCLAPVQDLLMAMKPLLRHWAHTDPRAFAQPDHPVARLLATIAHQGLAFRSPHDAGFLAYADAVHKVVRAAQVPGVDWQACAPGWIAGLQFQGACVSPAPLACASSFPPDEGAASADAAPADADQHRRLAAQVAVEIRQQADFHRAPGVIRRFLIGPWAQVVAHARLAAGADPQLAPSDPAARYMDLLPDLLWSSRLALTSRNRPRLIALAPSLLRTLRQGLDGMDYPRAHADAFFQTLLGLHEAAYKTLLEERPSVAACTGTAAPAAGRIRPPVRTDSLGLCTGAWVVLWHEGHTRRCQVRWASPSETLYVFTTAEGRPLSLTRRGVEQLQQLHRMRVLSLPSAEQPVRRPQRSRPAAEAPVSALSA